MSRTKFSIVKQTVWNIFAFSERIKNARILVSILVSFWDTFSTFVLIFLGMDVRIPFFQHFRSFWTETGAEVVPQIGPKSFKNKLLCLRTSFWWILGRLCINLASFWCTLGDLGLPLWRIWWNLRLALAWLAWLFFIFWASIFECVFRSIW